MNNPKMRVAALVLAMGLSTAAQAALEGRDLDGNNATAEAYYDTHLGITWLADANYAKTSGYDADGKMTWAAANTWAASLSFSDGVNVYGDWRLPITLQPDPSCSGGGLAHGYFCTGSEMGHLFYTELGGTAGQSVLESMDADLVKFANMQSDYYWSGTEYAPYVNGGAWNFGFYGGTQIFDDTTLSLYALAVSPGDVGVATIPEADTWTMLLAGLALLGIAAHHRNINHQSLRMNTGLNTHAPPLPR